jgi:hypothetical protein
MLIGWYEIIKIDPEVMGYEAVDLDHLAQNGER